MTEDRISRAADALQAGGFPQVADMIRRRHMSLRNAEVPPARVEAFRDEVETLWTLAAHGQRHATPGPHYLPDGPAAVRVLHGIYPEDQA